MIAEGLLGRLRVRAAPRQRSRSRTAARPRLRAGRRLRLAIGIAAVLAVLGGGGWLWLRDSSLVQVEHVAVTGASGPDAARIRSALVSAARNMTTLNIRLGQLRTAVAPYPVVKDLRVSTQFPHGIRIRVIEQVPVGEIVAAGRTTAVAGDGTLLHDVAASASLPVIPLQVPPAGSHVTDLQGRGSVALLAAAPYEMLARVSEVTTVAPHGLVAQVRGGPSIYFGDATRLHAKWIAASEVLADPGSEGAVYIDVTDPQRPAAGAGSDQSTAASAPSSATQTTPSSTTSGG
jgi:cell division protein FtsQ